MKVPALLVPKRKGRLSTQGHTTSHHRSVTLGRTRFRVGFSSRIPIVRSPYNAATNDQDRLDLHNVPQNSRMVTVSGKSTHRQWARLQYTFHRPLRHSHPQMRSEYRVTDVETCLSRAGMLLSSPDSRHTGRCAAARAILALSARSVAA